jgi:hypothetical protein
MSNLTSEQSTIRYVPCTPGGTFVFECEAKTRQGAIDKLLKAAAHMPYKKWPNFEKRGYEIVEFNEDEIP